jgi:hypothetical protein
MSRLGQGKAHASVLLGKVNRQQQHYMFPNRTRLEFTPQLNL